jgi:hypothetical protein
VGSRIRNHVRPQQRERRQREGKRADVQISATSDLRHLHRAIGWIETAAKFHAVWFPDQ